MNENPQLPYYILDFCHILKQICEISTNTSPFILFIITTIGNSVFESYEPSFGYLLRNDYAFLLKKPSLTTVWYIEK